MNTYHKGTNDRDLALSINDRICTYRAGYEAGRNAQVEILAEQRALEIVHQDALEALGFAVRAAEWRHGPSWAHMIREQAEAA